ncbi:ribose transport system permease protein [Hamadaea flava]|uniref:ABC transporter permease n=1 Tax=Hamadaea flava TaxID=1742688 RepID=A0ABV8LZX8_9ACTN|nr:hypothetical protein [Hamadaea flava]MCP2324672.1 ribose transport system permease protein [Hamadaea flava]
MTVLAPPITPEPLRPRRGASLVAHLGWEGILVLLAIVGFAYLVVQEGIDVIGRNVWLNFAATGLLASALAVSVRLRSVNLAVAAQAMLAGIIYAKLVQEDWPDLAAGAAAVVAVLILGLILGAITGVTGAPGWAVSIGGLGIAEAVSFGLSDAQGLVVPGTGRAEVWVVAIWAAVFVLGSVIGAVVFLATGLPRDSATFGSRVLRAIGSFALSSLVAGLAGVMFISYVGFASPAGDGGRLLSAAAVVLLAGISAATGRGGVLGTVLATLVVVFGNTALALEGVKSWVSYYLVASIAILIGVVVGAVLDRVGRPSAPPAPVAPPAPPPPLSPWMA